MERFIALVSPFILMPSIINTWWTCTLDALVLSMVYEYIEDEEIQLDWEQRKELTEKLEHIRNTTRNRLYWNMYGNQPEVVLRDAIKSWRIKRKGRLHSKEYIYQENTLMALDWFRYKEPWIIQSVSWDGELAPWKHVISIIWELEEYRVWLSDKARGYSWYVLVEKGFWWFYTYEK